MALHVMCDGEQREVVPKDGVKFTLKELQDFVGGYIEMYPHWLDPVMLVNEDGHSMKLPLNAFATYATGQLIVGNVVLLSAAEWAAQNEETESEDDDDSDEGNQLGADDDAMWDDGGYSGDDYNQEMWGGGGDDVL